VKDDIKSQRPRFEMLPHWLLDKASSREIHLYILLKRYAGEDQKCYPSRTTLARQMGATVKTVTRLIEGLVDHGAVTVTPRFDENGQQRSNLYWVRFYSPEEEGGTLETPPGGVITDPPGGDMRDPRNKPTLKETQEKDTGQRVTALADKQFDEFWEIYPRKVGKPQAKKAFKKALEEISLEEILSCTTAYRLARRGEDPKFTKHPATFLNAKPWQDEPAEVYDPDSWLNNPQTKAMPYGWNGIED
jgi:hypothetical protein